MPLRFQTSSHLSMEQGRVEEMLQLLLVAALFIASWLLLSKTRKCGKNLPPKPLAFPVVGHLHLLGNLPHHSLLKLSQKYGPFMLLKLGSQPTLVVSSAEAAKEMLTTHDLVFASRPRTTFSQFQGYSGADLAMAPYGEQWRNTRKLCTLELFTARQVELFQPVRGAEMSLFMAKLSKASETRQVVNMTDKLSEFTFNVMARMVIGKSYSKSADCEEDDEEAKEAHMFRDLILQCFLVGGGVHIGDWIPWLNWLDFSIPRMKQIHKSMDQFMQKQIDEHRAKYRSDNLNDFLDVMLSVSEQGQQLENTRMKGLIMDIFLAGTETSAVTVEWALAELLQHPEAMTKAQKELDTVVGTKRTVSESDCQSLNYLHAIVKETFRLHPPIPLLIPHKSTQECQLKQGLTIPAEAQLLVNAYAIGRDASVWENPLEFNPDRFLGLDPNIDVRGQNFELLPFGSGRRSCPGMNLGLATVNLMLASLLHGFEWHTASGKDVDLTEGFGFSLHPARPLELVPVARIH